MNNDFHIPPEGPPQGGPPQLFDKIGQQVLQDMIWRQYQLLSESKIAHMFPEDQEELKAAAERNAEFMCGILGGPKVYQQKHGPPQMRRRHMPFAIDENARQEWLRCYHTALKESDNLGLSPDELEPLVQWVERFSAWMVNRKS